MKQAQPFEDLQLRVRPAAGGWRVDCVLTGSPLMFLSGAKAEAKAHALAQVVAATGRDARVVVLDRREQVVGSTRYFADQPGGRSRRP